MLRRDFLRRTVTGFGAALLANRAATASPFETPDTAPLPQKFNAHDEVVLGHTGIRTSRLAMGTGTIGGGKHSNQTRLGTDPFVSLLLDGYNNNGLRFFDTADSYGSHPYVAAAIKQLPRDKVTVLTKSDTRDPAGLRGGWPRHRIGWRVAHTPNRVAGGPHTKPGAPFMQPHRMSGHSRSEPLSSNPPIPQARQESPIQ